MLVLPDPLPPCADISLASGGVAAAAAAVAGLLQLLLLQQLAGQAAIVGSYCLSAQTPSFWVLVVGNQGGPMIILGLPLGEGVV